MLGVPPDLSPRLPTTSAVLPFGVTLLAAGWSDEYVAGLAAAYERSTGLAAGPRGHGVTPYRTPAQQ